MVHARAALLLAALAALFGAQGADAWWYTKQCGGKYQKCCKCAYLPNYRRCAHRNKCSLP